VRRLEQAEQHAGLLLQPGLGAEIVARQVGKAELLLGREFPGQVQVDLGGQRLAAAQQLGRRRLVEAQQHVGRLDLHPLAESSSICTEDFRLPTSRGRRGICRRHRTIATRWLNIGIVIQPSEILKIAMPLMLAWWFQKREGQLRPLDFAVGWRVAGRPGGPDHEAARPGHLAAGAGGRPVGDLLRRAELAPGAAAGAGGGGGHRACWCCSSPHLCAEGVRWSVLRDYQQQRICTLLDPAKDPLGKGFHIIQGMIAIGSGGVWGKGFMQGTQTHLEFIPERTTDFIFAAFSEEFGLIGNLAADLRLPVPGAARTDIALEAPTLFARLLAGALAMIFFSYAFVNMGMVSGILPVVGVPLPFISYGGTAMVTLGLALGMLMSIGKARRLVQT
jgi:rod shape determining protein RodA